MFNIFLAFATIAGFFIAFFPNNNVYVRVIVLLGTTGLIFAFLLDTNNYVRVIILLGTAFIVTLVKMCEVIHENKKNTINEKHKELDSTLLKEIKKILNDDNTIEFIRTHDFAGAFRQDFTVPLMEYNHRIETDPEFYFLDSDLNKLKKDLDINIVEFLRILINKTFDLEVNKDLRGIPKDWREKVPERYEEAVDKANHHADKIIENYDELLQLARKKAM